MSRRGDCYDNAVMDSFFSSVKSETADHFASCGEAKMELFDSLGQQSGTDFAVEFFRLSRPQEEASCAGSQPAEFWSSAGQVRQPVLVIRAGSMSVERRKSVSMLSRSRSNRSAQAFGRPPDERVMPALAETRARDPTRVCRARERIVLCCQTATRP
jgi:transposase InsO family protein